MFSLLFLFTKYRKHLCLSVGRSVIMLPLLRTFQRRLAVWAGRVDGTTGKTPGLLPRRAVALVCLSIPGYPKAALATMKPALLLKYNFEVRFWPLIGLY